MGSYEGETPNSLFPGYSNSTKQFFFDFSLKIEHLTRTWSTVDMFLSLLSVFINSIHIGVLSTKNMRKSVVNMFLITISLNYIIWLLITVYLRHLQTKTVASCDPPASFIRLQIQCVFYALHVFTFLSATWLSILLAVLRWLILKFPFNYKLQKLGIPKNGFNQILGTLFVTFPISFLYYFRFKVAEYSPWTPNDCPGYPSNYSIPRYGMKQSSLFEYGDFLVYRIYLVTEAMFSKLIPTILYPILSVLLLNQIREGKRNRERLGASSNENDKTTFLITSMTVSHLICDLPKGLLSLTQSYFVSAGGFLLLITNSIVLSTTLVIFNTILQCFICCALSSNYRNTVTEIVGNFGIQRKQSEVSSVKTL